MQILLQALIAVVAIFGAWWAIRRMLPSATPIEPAEDPFAEVPAPLKRNPKGKAGSVALEEPQDDDTDFLH